MLFDITTRIPKSEEIVKIKNQKLYDTWIRWRVRNGPFDGFFWLKGRRQKHRQRFNEETTHLKTLRKKKLRVEGKKH